MSCIRLVPPPPFLPVPGRPPVPWPQWHRMFENFLLASGASDFKPERRKALLIHSLGVEGQRVFSSLLLTSDAAQSAIQRLRLNNSTRSLASYAYATSSSASCVGGPCVSTSGPTTQEQKAPRSIPRLHVACVLGAVSENFEYM
ncbi:hypothetical protein HPB49_019627 [Dermacentor silvarum]|uniref:Uncharacterized protein n=1 Tax=Dermacentor silvarum TaxID=543639 RepID=A0ACB8E2T2_DERSI|nr:hypothetical protein HPB49_019627 [Dermacentor silvarum]